MKKTKKYSLSEKLVKLGHKVIVIDNLSGGFIKNINKHLNNKNFKFINEDINNLKKKKFI